MLPTIRGSIAITEKPSQRQSVLFFASLTAGFAGLQAAFSVQFATVTFTFVSLGLSPIARSLLWLIPPICGAVLQPLFGKCSDRFRSTWGRRRPFVLGGNIGIAVSLIGYAWCQSIAQPIGQASFVGQLSFITLNVAIQSTQASLRALITDTCSKDQQVQANAWASRVTQLTSTLSYGIIYYSFSEDLDDEGSVKRMVLFSVLLITITTFFTLLAIKEEPSDIPDPQITKPASGQPNSLPLKIKLIYGAQFFSWYAWFPLLSNINSFVRLSAPRYLDATHINNALGSLALLVMSGIALLCSILLPPFYSRHLNNDARHTSRTGILNQHLERDESLVSLRTIWFLSQGLFAIVVSFVVVFQPVNTAVFAMIPMGFCWFITQWVPYTLLNVEIIKSGMENEAGAVVGFHNTFVALPQILASGINAVVLVATDQLGFTSQLGAFVLLFLPSIFAALISAYVIVL